MSGNGPSDRAHRLPTFVRQKGRALSNRQKALVRDLLPTLSVPLETGAPLVPENLFEVSLDRLCLEIGFGGGEHLIGQAHAHPSTGYIGVEPFLDGVAKVLTAISEAKTENIRLHRGDARDVMDALPDACLDQIYILFPDPWPKARHHKRRLIQPDFVELAARCLRPSGHLRFATDVESYLNQALATFLASDQFTWTASCADDWRTPPADNIPTRYQEKRLGDIPPVWLDFVRA